MRMRIQDLSGWLDLTYRRPKIDDLWSSSDDGSRVSQPSAQVRTLLPPIFKIKVEELQYEARTVVLVPYSPCCIPPHAAKDPCWIRIVLVCSPAPNSCMHDARRRACAEVPVDPRVLRLSPCWWILCG